MVLSLDIYTGAISPNLKSNPISSLYSYLGSPISHSPLQIIFLKINPVHWPYFLTPIQSVLRPPLY